jgi:Flp pilus assembly protein TadD
VFLARVLRDDGGSVEGRHAATVAAVKVAPNNVDALTAYAIEEMRRGDGDGALQSVARAAELEPWNPAVFVTRALVLGAVGRCDEAVAAGQQALDLLPVRVLADERDRIERACRALPDP